MGDSEIRRIHPENLIELWQAFFRRQDSAAEDAVPLPIRADVFEGEILPQLQADQVTFLRLKSRSRFKLEPGEKEELRIATSIGCVRCISGTLVATAHDPIVECSGGCGFGCCKNVGDIYLLECSDPDCRQEYRAEIRDRGVWIS